MKNYITREDVLTKAVEDCWREMFAKAQPEADYDNLIAEYEAGKIDEEKDGPVYDRHYLSMEEYMYIMEKYMEAYRIKSEWKEDMEVLEDYLTNGGSKDAYIPDHTDNNGNFHPGYRSYEKVAPLKEQITKTLCSLLSDKDEKHCEGIAYVINNIVMETIKNCKEFYCFNSDEQKFRNTLLFGATPTSNKETVKKWWKDHYGVDIEIEDRIPKLFWYMDHNYTHEELIDEFGENYDEILMKEWEDEKAAKKAKHEELVKKLSENNDTDN